MKNLKLILVCFLLTVSTVVFGQNKLITGKVTDQSGAPVPGASVTVQGTTIGAITLEDGTYSIQAPEGSNLLFTFFGMKTKAVKVEGQTTINVVLEEDSLNLDEVVVTAQGLTRKQKAIGYSAQSLTEEQLTVTHSSELGNSLAGKIAGAQFWGAGGTTFNEGSIVLRGATSYSDAKGNAPIYVIDGAITDQGAVNMDDVETLNVLKGPSATALYGSRGANGAVIITTKKAAEGKSVIEFSHTASVESYYNHIKFNKLYGGGSATSGLSAAAAAEGADAHDWTSPAYLFTDLGDGTYSMDYYSDENWGPRFDGTTLVRSALSWDPTSKYYGTADTWKARLNLKDVTQNALTNTTNIAVSKSVKGLSTRISFTNVNREGVLPNSKAVRRSFSINSTLKPASWLTADVSYRFRLRENKNAATEGYSADGNIVCDFTQWGQTNVDLSQLKDYKRADGSWRTWNIVSENDLSANYHDNPFATLDNYNSKSTAKYHLISADVYATLPYNIKLGTRINNYIYNNQTEQKHGTGSINWESYFRTYHVQDNDFTIQGYATWNDHFIDDKLSVEAALFAEQRQYDYKYLNSYTNGGLSVIQYFGKF
ncbi:MAG: carboxypeptidase-like regulatory domain-containing protein [Bacteroidales bacterium]|nr:carboxypeptidase-like regulatory domain-containing protein [Bacteroidales bacterium]